jgi:hypothetical protein
MNPHDPGMEPDTPKPRHDDEDWLRIQAQYIEGVE